MPWPLSTISRRRSSNRRTTLCALKSGGMLLMRRPMICSRSIVDACLAAARIVVGKAHARPAAVEPVRLVGAEAVGRRELLLEMRPEARLHALALFQRHDALLGQALGIDVDHRRMRLDRLVHQRLREHRLVGLVVAVAPVAEHVDDDRLLELLPELGGDLGDVHHGFRDRRRSRGRSAPRSCARRPSSRARSASGAGWW